MDSQGWKAILEWTESDPRLVESAKRQYALLEASEAAESDGLARAVEELAERLAEDEWAFDRSVRFEDLDGHMKVGKTPISKANVCPYLGREIPGWRQLGLDEKRVYYLYRDPEELRKAAKTFAGKPLLLRHEPVSADSHPRELVVGTIGDAVSFEAPYLTASLSVWDGDAIRLIKSGKRRQLSSSYRYKPDMRPGISPEGVRFDGRMTDIVGNHCAIVPEGRAGSDVMVADSANDEVKKEQARMSIVDKAKEAVSGFLLPKMASDALPDLTSVFASVNEENFADQIPAIVEDIGRVCGEKFASDANIQEITALLEALGKVAGGSETPAPTVEGADAEGGKAPPFAKKSEEENPKGAEGGAQPTPSAGNPEDARLSKLKAYLSDKVTPEVLAQVEAIMKEQPKEPETPPANNAPTELSEDGKKMSEETINKAAMDAAIENAVKVATENANKRAAEIRTAEKDVRPYVGEFAVTYDSADAIYTAALEALGIKTDGLHPSALRPLLLLQPKPDSKKPVHRAAPAMDSTSKGEFYDRFPEAKRIGVA